MNRSFRRIFQVLCIFAASSAIAFGLENKPDRMFIIDDDIGMNRAGCEEAGCYIAPKFKICDPDGGLELIYALREPGVEIMGVTIMMGCSTTPVCTVAAKNILKVMGREDIPVLEGAHHPSDLGKETPAARFIIDTVMNNPGKIEIIATGPLTNIATAMMIEPRLPQNWRELHFATGEFNRALGQTTDLYLISLAGIPDMNVNTDAVATRYVLENGGPFPIYPNEIMDDVSLNKKDWKKIKNSGTPLGDFVAEEIRPVIRLGSGIGRLVGMNGMFVHGVIPTAIALDPACETESMESAVIMKKFGRKGYAFVLSDDPKLPKHKIHVRLKNPEKLHDTLIERLR